MRQRIQQVRLATEYPVGKLAYCHSTSSSDNGMSAARACRMRQHYVYLWAFCIVLAQLGLALLGTVWAGGDIFSPV